VHPWTPGGAAALITIEEHDDIRKWLRGEGAFPRLMALAITIARPQHAQITFNPPEEVREGHKRLYHFHALGTTATLWAGALTPLINLLGETRLYGFTTPPRGTLSREPIVDGASERAASTVNHSDFVFARSMIWSLSSKLFSCH
jgi:hypothetical protein